MQRKAIRFPVRPDVPLIGWQSRTLPELDGISAENLD